MEKIEKIADMTEVLGYWTEVMRGSEDEKMRMKASELLAKYLAAGEKSAPEKFCVNVIDDIV